MKVLYLAPNIRIPGENGGSTHVAMVREALTRRGHEVLLVARRGSVGDRVLPVGFGVAPGLRHALAAVYFARTLATARRFAPDVIYERYSAFGLGIALQRALGVPSVLMTLDRDASPVSLRYARRIVATSSAFLPPRYIPKYREVRWGVDVARFEAPADDILRTALAPSGERLVVYTGSFATWHGLELLVEVAAAWTGPPMRLVLVGRGEAFARIRAIVHARRLGRRVELVGAVAHEDVARYLAVADACIAPYAPSLHPMFRVHGMNRDPIKVLEYMAAAKPTITIDIPRFRELFHEGQDVVFYRPESAESLTAALRQVLEDDAFAARIAAAGRSLVERRYTWDSHALDLETIFGEAIAS